MARLRSNRLEQIWESANKLVVLPSGLDPMDFVFASAYLVVIEDLSTNDLAQRFFEGVGIGSASNTNFDDGACAPQTVTSAVAIAYGLQQ